MKRLFATILAGVMACSLLSGCGSGSTSTATSGAGSTGTAASGAASTGSSGGNLNITLIMSLRDEFLSSLEAGAKKAASEVGVNLTTQDANNDTSKLIQYIESSANAGDDAIIINMVDPETAQQCIDAAGDMKVVFVNRPPVDTGLLNENAVYVGSDEMTSGAFQGEFLASYFKDKGKSDIKYLLLNGTLGQVATTNRTLSVLQALKDNGINATEASAPLAADFDRATAMDMISPLLKTTEFDCIIANNDSMALGAIEAMTSQGLDPASVPIVGIDATVDGRQAIKDGTMAMSVFQDPNGQGFGALMAAKNMIDGKPISDGTDFTIDDENQFIVWVPFEPVTPDNVADFDNR